VRIDQNACVGRRLAELDRLLSESRNGRTVMLLRPIGRPAAFSGYYSVWDNKDAQLNAHLPLQLRLRYGELYDELRDADALATHEVDVWRSLSQFERDGVIALPNTRELHFLDTDALEEMAA